MVVGHQRHDSSVVCSRVTWITSLLMISLTGVSLGSELLQCYLAGVIALRDDPDQRVCLEHG